MTATLNQPWESVDLFDIRFPEHCKALADHCEQAGREAYQHDTTTGATVLPLPDWRGVAWDDKARRTRAKVYAGQLLSACPTQFGDAFPLKLIIGWWLLGYDKAQEGIEP